MKITKEILEQGRWSDGTYSDPQLRIFGFTEDNCDRWQEQILGDEEPLWKIKLFWGLKEWVYVEKRIFKANGKLQKFRLAKAYPDA